RIAVYYNTDSSSILSTVDSSSAKIHAYGSGGSGGGQAGTVYLEHKGVDTHKAGEVHVNDAGGGTYRTGATGLNPGNYKFKLIKLTNTGTLTVQGQDSTLTVTDSAGLDGDSTVPALSVLGTFIYDNSSALNVQGLNLDLQ